MQDIAKKKVQKITPEVRKIGNEAQRLKNRKKLRLCDAINAVMDAHNIQDRPTREDRYKSVRIYLKIKSDARHTAADDREERKEIINNLQMSFPFE